MTISIIYQAGRFALRNSSMVSLVFQNHGQFDILVECPDRYYGAERDLMLQAYYYIQSIAPCGCELSTVLKPKSGGTGRDEIGKHYIDWILYDAEVIALETTVVIHQ